MGLVVDPASNGPVPTIWIANSDRRAGEREGEGEVGGGGGRCSARDERVNGEDGGREGGRGGGHIMGYCVVISQRLLKDLAFFKTSIVHGGQKISTIKKNLIEMEDLV